MPSDTLVENIIDDTCSKVLKIWASSASCEEELVQLLSPINKEIRSKLERFIAFHPEIRQVFLDIQLSAEYEDLISRRIQVVRNNEKEYCRQWEKTNLNPNEKNGYLLFYYKYLSKIYEILLCECKELLSNEKLSHEDWIKENHFAGIVAKTVWYKDPSIQKLKRNNERSIKGFELYRKKELEFELLKIRKSSKDQKKDFVALIDGLNDEDKPIIESLSVTSKEVRDLIKALPLSDAEEQTFKLWVDFIKTSPSSKDYEEWVLKHIGSDLNEACVLLFKIHEHFYNSFCESYLELLYTKPARSEHDEWVLKNIPIAPEMVALACNDKIVAYYKKNTERHWKADEDYEEWYKNFNQMDFRDYYEYMDQYNGEKEWYMEQFKQRLFCEERDSLRKLLEYRINSEDCSRNNYIAFLEKVNNASYLCYLNLPNEFYEKEKQRFDFSKYQRIERQCFDKATLSFIQLQIDNQHNLRWRDAIWENYGDNGKYEPNHMSSPNDLEKHLKHFVKSHRGYASVMPHKGATILHIPISKSPEKLACEIYELTEIKQSLKIVNKAHMEFEYEGYNFFFVWVDEEKYRSIILGGQTARSILKVIWDAYDRGISNSSITVEELCKEELYKLWVSIIEIHPTHYHNWLLNLNSCMAPYIKEFSSKNMGSRKKQLHYQLEKCLEAENHLAMHKWILSLSNLDKCALSELEKEFEDESERFPVKFFEDIADLPSKEYLEKLVSTFSFDMHCNYNQYSDQSPKDKSTFLNLYQNFKSAKSNKASELQGEVKKKIVTEIENCETIMSDLFPMGNNNLLLIPRSYNIISLAAELSSIEDFELVDSQNLHFKSKDTNYYLIWGDCYTKPKSYTYDPYSLESLTRAIWLKSSKDSLAKSIAI